MSLERKRDFKETETVSANSENNIEVTAGTKPKVKKNTAVFVSGLPSDTTSSELYDYFCKYGIIMDDIFTGRPRIKMYYDEESNDGEEEEGSFKGEALVVYLREESAQMACDLLDESHFRFDHPPIRVHRAQFEEVPRSEETTELSGKKVEKKIWKQHMQNMQKKLEWSTNDAMSPEEEEVMKAELKKRQKYNRIVILKGMFGPEEWEEQEDEKRRKLVTELKTDLLEEASKLGTVTSIHVLGEQGVCSVKFRETESAAACLKVMNGRKYGVKRIKASLYDGSFSLKEEKMGSEEREREDEERIDRFGQWLEQSAADNNSD